VEITCEVGFVEMEDCVLPIVVPLKRKKKNIMKNNIEEINT
jgi:hypothetical protein